MSSDLGSNITPSFEQAPRRQDRKLKLSREHRRGKLRDVFGYRRDITLKANADSAKTPKVTLRSPRSTPPR